MKRLTISSLLLQVLVMQNQTIMTVMTTAPVKHKSDFLAHDHAYDRLHMLSHCDGLPVPSLNDCDSCRYACKSAWSCMKMLWTMYNGDVRATCRCERKGPNQICSAAQQVVLLFV